MSNIGLAIYFFTGMGKFNGNPQFAKLKRRVFRAIMSGANVELSLEQFNNCHYLTVQKEGSLLIECQKKMLSWPQLPFLYLNGFRTDHFDISLFYFDKTDSMVKGKESWEFDWNEGDRSIDVEYHKITNCINQAEQKVTVTKSGGTKWYVAKVLKLSQSEEKTETHCVEADATFQEQYKKDLKRLKG